MKCQLLAPLEAELPRLREAGFDDAEITEIVADVALNIFTNYFNLVAGTEIDFPRVTDLEAA
jgi:alkylhydroperoxidase family enzyme